jgi:hypothetical protein
LKSSEELILDVEPSHICLNVCLQTSRSLQFMCSCFQRNKNPQTVKLYPRSSIHQPYGQLLY